MKTTDNNVLKGCFDTPTEGEVDRRQKPRTKHIMFLVSSMQGGGAERVAAMLCNHWVESGHRVTLMPTFSGKGSCDYALDCRVKLDYLADRAKVGIFKKNRIRRLFLLRRAISELKPDVIVSFLPDVNIAAILASIGQNIPVVVAERTYPPAMPLSFVLERLRRFTYPRADAVVMQTQQGLEWLRARCPEAHGVAIANPVVIPLPESGARVCPDDVLDAQKRVLLAVGRLETEKGFDLLLEAFAHLKHRFLGWDLVILGEGAERASLEQQRHMLGLADRVHLPGRVGNLKEWFQRAEIFVLSSRFEGFPNSLLEAMAHGLPAVSIDCDSGPRDIVRHNLDGILVPKHDGVQGLVRATEQLFVSPALREQMARSAVEVQGRFSMQRIACEWDNLLDSVA